MRLLTDFIPIMIFFVVFKAYDVYTATAAAMLVAIIQVVFYRLKYAKFEILPLVTLFIIIVLGSATLLFHNDLFIKWKITVIDWVFAAILLASQWTSQPVLKHLLAQTIQLPNSVWKTMNLSWAIFFSVLGGVNLYVAYHFSTATWVNFKLFGLLGLTLVFAVGQALFLANYLKEPSK